MALTADRSGAAKRRSRRWRALPDRGSAGSPSGLPHPARACGARSVEALGRLKHPDASAAIRARAGRSGAVVREAAVTALDRLGVRGLSAGDSPAWRATTRREPSGVAAAAALGRGSGAARPGRWRCA